MSLITMLYLDHGSTPRLDLLQHAERRQGHGRRRGLPALHRHRQLVHRRRRRGVASRNNERGRHILCDLKAVLRHTTGHTGAVAAAPLLLLETTTENVLSVWLM